MEESVMGKTEESSASDCSRHLQCDVSLPGPMLSENFFYEPGLFKRASMPSLAIQTAKIIMRKPKGRHTIYLQAIWLLEILGVSIFDGSPMPSKRGSETATRMF